jgi:UDP-GlcNAc:undecaprenyl-phosphate GlcNAc-1-phosphate transferase
MAAAAALPFVLAPATALAAALLLVPATRRLGLLDVPGTRSVHRSPVPRTGGIGLLGGLLAGVLVALAAGAPATGLLAYGAPALLLFGVGLWDDAVRLSARTKLLLQLAAAILAVGMGMRWGGGAFPPFDALTFGAGTPAMTVLWLFAVGTVVNFADGIDLITCATTCVLLAAGAAAGVGPADGALHAAAAGAAVGLAFWNASPARVFAGDAGTHVLGFLVASLACTGPGRGGDTTRALPWALASAPLLPLVIDVGWGIAAKLRRGLPLSAAHHDHLYQRLTRVGWSHAAVAARYALLALAALVVVARIAPHGGLAAALAVGGAVLGLHLMDGLRASRRLRCGKPQPAP